MILNVSVITLWCLDQEQTRDFYVGNLGFEVRKDVTMGDFRWLTIGHPSQPELDVTLMKPGPPLSPEAAGVIRGQLESGGMGGIGLCVDNCQKTYDELTAKGVTFLEPPAERPYGVEAVMRDNTGNWLSLVEPS